MANLRLTTVKVLDELYEKQFKIFTIRDGINLQKLVNRSLDLYVKNEEFRKQVNGHKDLLMSGSNL